MTRRQWQAPWGYYWKVVVDPTRSGEDPGMFYGGHFRWSDIELPPACNEKIPCPWPSGTVFENVKTGERVVIKRGKVVREGTNRRIAQKLREILSTPQPPQTASNLSNRSTDIHAEIFAGERR